MRVHRSLLSEFFTLVITLIFSGALLAQDNLKVQFDQGKESYPAQVIPNRIALVLDEMQIQKREHYKEILADLNAEPIRGMTPNIVSINRANLKDGIQLSESARKILNERPQLLIDSGYLITLGEEKSPFVVTSQIIVQLNESANPDVIKSIAEKFGGEVISANPFNKLQFVVLVKEGDPLEISNSINREPETQFAHPNFYRVIEDRQVIPNDTFFPNQWHLNNTGQNGGTVDADIDTDLAWDFGLGNNNIIIAVIDDALEIDHPDLSANLYTNGAEVDGDDIDNDGNGQIDDVNGWDFTSCTGAIPCGDNDPMPVLAGDDHGTSVAGGALAQNNNNLGVSGTCPSCTFMPIRATNGSVFAHGLAFGYAQAQGADIITNSWGYSIGTPTTANVETAINNAAVNGRNGLGSVVLLAMTNSAVDNCTGTTPDISSPINVIAVSRVTNQDQFSAGGFGNCMDVLGPTARGTLQAVTTDLQGNSGRNTGVGGTPGTCGATEPNSPPSTNLDYTFCFGGTSFATPVTAGVVGLILSQDNTLTRAEVQQLLQDTSDKVEHSVGDYSATTGFSQATNSAGIVVPTHGYGRINAFEAVRVVSPDASTGGKDGIDVFVRDNVLDWGNTEQLSNLTFETTRGFLAHWRSPDIKVDAPPFITTAPTTSLEFDAFVSENPLSNTLNKVYVRVHNRGQKTASDLNVKLHWSFAGAGLPSLPTDFWAEFPDDSSDTSVWHPMSNQIVASLSYSGTTVAGSAADNSAVLTFDFDAPVFDPSLPDPDHYCLFAVISSDEDPVSATSLSSLVPDFITPRDNNVTHRNVSLEDSGRSDRFERRFYISNPFDFVIRTRLVADMPKGWQLKIEGVKINQPFDLEPGKRIPVQVQLFSNEKNQVASINFVQTYIDSKSEKELILGGMSYDFSPDNSNKDTAKDKEVGIERKN